MEKLYADILERMEQAGETSAADKLVAHLKIRGRIKLLPGILRELKLRQSGKKATSATLEVARESDKAHAQKEAQAAGITAEQVQVNHSLISGWRARSGGLLVDRSGKRALIDLYRAITK